MAISFIGAVSANATSLTPPAHEAGDLLVCFAFRNGSTTAATLPSGWTNIANNGANTCSGRIAYRIATSSSTTCTGWTNASGLVLHVYRGAAGVGAFGTSTASSASMTYPSFTAQSNAGDSWIAGFGGHRSTNLTGIATPPTFMTNRTSLIGANGSYTGHDSNTNASGWNTSYSVSVGGTASGWRTYTLQILNARPAVLTSPTVTQASSTSGTPQVTTDVNSGTIYMVAVPDGDTPSIAQIKAGQRSNGTAAIADQNMTVTATGVQTFTTFTGLTTGTEYDFWFVHTNSVGDSAAVKADVKIQQIHDTGWKFPGAVNAVNPYLLNASLGQSSGWSNPWTNLNNVKAADGVNASSVDTTNSSTSPQLIVGSEFAFGIPTGATVRGIEVEISTAGSRNSGFSSTSSSVALLLDKTIAGYETTLSHVLGNSVTTQSFAETLSTTPAVKSLGGSSDTWGTVRPFVLTGTAPNTYYTYSTARDWSASDFGNNFGLALKISSGFSSTFSVAAYVDYLKVRVSYTLPPPATLSTPGYNSGARYPFVTTDNSTGTIYYVLVPDGDTPSVAQIKLGQKNNGYAAIAWESKSVTASGVQTFGAIDGMEGEPPYKLWFVHTTASGDSEPLGYSFTPADPSTANAALFWAFP